MAEFEESAMKARDVMTTQVVTIGPDATVAELAELLLKHRFSAVPVIDANGELVGIVSEGDLLHRAEVGTERRRPWLLRVLTESETLAADYVKSHARKVADAMTRRVVTAGPDTPLGEIAALLEKKRIKRVPIMQNGKLAGIVTRANLVQAFAAMQKRPQTAAGADDAAIRDRLLARLREEPWAHLWQINVIVKDGVVDLWGTVGSGAEHAAVRIAAENMPAVRGVNDHLVEQPIASGAY
jgi:CBS domain-containing protein